MEHECGLSTMDVLSVFLAWPESTPQDSAFSADEALALPKADWLKRPVSFAMPAISAEIDDQAASDHGYAIRREHCRQGKNARTLTISRFFDCSATDCLQWHYSTTWRCFLFSSPAPNVGPSKARTSFSESGTVGAGLNFDIQEIETLAPMRQGIMCGLS